MNNCGEYRAQVASYLATAAGQKIPPAAAIALLELDPDLFGLTDGMVDREELQELTDIVTMLAAKPAANDQRPTLSKCGVRESKEASVRFLLATETYLHALSR
jgi:hypothetical protein